MIPMKPRLLLAIFKRASWMGLRITCLGFKLTEKSQFSDRNEGCVSFHNKKMMSPTILSNQNKQRSEILSERPLVGCDYTIPWRSSVSDSDEISNQRLKNHGYWSKNVTGSKRHQVLFGFTHSAVLLCGTQEGKHIIQ